MQLTFEFLKETDVRWEQLDEVVRTEFVEKLAQVIAKAALPDLGREESDDD